MRKFEIYLAENTQDTFFYGGFGRTQEYWSKAQALESFNNGGGYILSGEVEGDTLEDAFRLAQNLDKPWNPAKPCRSLSVGDIVKDGEALFIVAPVGFDKL